MPDEPPTYHSAQCPESGCTLPINVLVHSSEDTVHGGHMQNLMMYSTDIVKPLSKTESGVVHSARIPHSDATTKLLLQVMHNRPQPDLSELEWDVLKDFTAAVEKYRIYSMIGMCKMQMEALVSEHPFDIFIYASEAGYTALSERALEFCSSTHPLECFVKSSHVGLRTLQDKVSKSTFSLAPQAVLDALKGTKDWSLTFSAWVLQREAYKTAALAILQNPPQGNQHKGGLVRCPNWYQFHGRVTSAMYESGMALDPTTCIERREYMLEDCKQCMQATARWKIQFAQIGVAAFSTYLASLDE